jgi:hypothetical protein
MKITRYPDVANPTGHKIYQQTHQTGSAARLCHFSGTACKFPCECLRE